MQHRSYALCVPLQGAAHKRRDGPPGPSLLNLCCCLRLHAEILNVDVSAQAHVVSEIPAGIVGVFIDDDVIGVPEPSVTVGYVVGSHAPVPSVEPEAAGAAASEMPAMAGTEAAG